MTLVHAYYSRTFAKKHGSKRMFTRKGGTVSVTHLHSSPKAEYEDTQYVGLVRSTDAKRPAIAG